MSWHILTWNLMHGRSDPPAGRELLGEFADLLAGWRWDVALLQEVPPWWPSALADRAGADQRHALTSRNSLAAVRRAVAVRHPDLIKSNGGGANAILVRGSKILAHRVSRLGWWPERRWMHAVQLSDGVWVGNLHTNSDARQGIRASEVLREWAAAAPVVLGGDFNVRAPELPGLTLAGGHGVDQIYLSSDLSGGQTSDLSGGQTEVLDRGRLSDHAPVLVTVRKERV
jgi:endonuclease/exonuclease/phosphatase family metal-dependent hydrolase